MEIQKLKWEQINSKKYKLYIPELRLTLFLVKQLESTNEPTWRGIGHFDYKSKSQTFKTELEFSRDEAKTKLIGQLLVGLNKVQTEISLLLM